MLNQLQFMMQKIQEEKTHMEDVPYWMMMLKHGQAKLNAELKWCDETIAALKKLERNHQHNLLAF